MIIDANELTVLPEFKNHDIKTIQRKLDGLETLIRKYTNNNFQNRNVRFKAESRGNRINGVHPFIKKGDTIQISDSKVNDGLYIVKDITDTYIEVDKDLFSVNYNLVTKIEYPLDIQDGVINLMKWDVMNRSKVGIKSETISRHSVTYFDLDATNQLMGYPVSLLGFLEPYKKVRF